MTLLIQTLNFRITKDDLEKLFSEFGSCSVMMGIGEATVEFSDRTEAHIACNELNNYFIKDTYLNITKLFHRKVFKKHPRLTRKTYAFCKNIKLCKLHKRVLPDNRPIDGVIDLRSDEE